jgi:[ribosomal protein S18]-alanine N-acetyltransferase
MFRNATTADLSAIAGWVSSQRDCDLWTGGKVTFPVDPATLPSCIGFSEQHAYVWARDGQPVGFGQVIVKPIGRAHLATIIVDPAVRGRGYGKQLVAALLAQARLQGSTISLNVDALNATALALYLGLGFADATRPPNQLELPGVRYMEATTPTTACSHT